jgi:drug/metabolite transporter (DMT)-like permease
LPDHLIVIAMALFAALLFSLGNQTSRRALDYAVPSQVTMYQIGVSVTLYWMAAPFYMKTAYWLSPAVFFLAAAGLIRPLISANLGTIGTRMLGPTIASTMSACGPLLSVTLGVVLLSETLHWQTAVGTAGIVTSIVVLSWHGNNKPDWPWWALLFPFGAAFIRAASHALAKLGLEFIPSPIFVALIAYSVSFPLACLYHRYRHKRQPAPDVPQSGILWMILSGSLYGVAVLVLNTALLWGDLVIVSPIVACTPFFTLILGVWGFGEKQINTRTVVAVLLVVPSVILIGLSRG